MDLATQFTFYNYPRLADHSQPWIGEYPPHPDRVLQAMISAGAETRQDFSILSCLESSPAIQAGKIKTWQAPKNYVPENFKRKQAYHTGALKYSPHIIPETLDDFSVTYLWRSVPEDLVEPISNIVEQVTHIGRACSFVKGETVSADSVNPNYIPDDHGKLFFRTPYPGRVKDLKAAYKQGLRCPKKHTTRYKKTKEAPVFTEWGELFVLKPNKTLSVYETVEFTDLFRKTAFSITENNLSGFIHGHDTHRHIAWASIPEVDHPYAKGKILGLGCWTPRDMSENERISVIDIICKIKESGIKDISLDFDFQNLMGLQLNTWADASCHWASVTPIALPRWPKRGKRTIIEILLEHLKQRGLPKPIKLKTSDSSIIQGSPNFLKKFKCHGQPKFLCHAEIEWESPVQGPLLLGTDRYFGGGLFRPIRIKKGYEK